VVSALIKADKHFDLLVVPGENHGAARSGTYAVCGQRKPYEFFVEHLMGAVPPKWNAPASAGTSHQR
jgi:hypothetical protein